MSNDALDTPIYDAAQKTNLLNVLSMGAIQKLPKIAIIPAELSPEEYQNKHQIPLPPAIQKTWSEHGNIEFNNSFSEDSYNGHSIVKRFIFSPDGRHFNLYNYLEDLAPTYSKKPLKNNSELIKKCFMVFAELEETYNNEKYLEIFYFDAIGNIDSLRISGSNYEKPVAHCIKSIIDQKDSYLSHMQQLEDNEKRKTEEKKIQIELEKSDHSILGQYIQKIPKCLKGIHKEIENENHNWEIHEGGLFIEGNWQADNINLIITGNLHVKGVYDGYTKGYSFVVVLGDMTAGHIVCWYGLSVAGNLTVNGLINIEHYLFPFETAGNLRARHMSIQHHQRFVHWDRLFVDSTCGDHTEETPEKTLQIINPELLAASIIEDGIDSLIVNFDASLRCLLDGKSPFREIPLSDELVEKIIQYADDSSEDKYSQETLVADMQLEPLLALVIANHQNIDEENLQYLQAYIGLHGKGFDKAIELTLDNVA